MAAKSRRATLFIYGGENGAARLVGFHNELVGEPCSFAGRGWELFPLTPLENS